MSSVSPMFSGLWEGLLLAHPREHCGVCTTGCVLPTWQAVVSFLWAGRASPLLHPDPADISSICFPSWPGRRSSSLPTLSVEGTGTPALTSSLFLPLGQQGLPKHPLPYYCLPSRYSWCPTSPPVNCCTAITSYHCG